MILSSALNDFDLDHLAPVAALIPPRLEAAVPQPVTRKHPPGLTALDVAVRLYDQGYVALTLPRREEDLCLAILKAFETPWDGRMVRAGEIPARRCDLLAVRQHLEIITREAERYGRSLECARYRPAFMAPIGRA